MMDYVVGLDGGGTKTDVLITDTNGNPVHSFQSGAINYNGESVENVKRNLKDIIKRIEAHMGDLTRCGAVCIGTAGISNAKVREEITQAVRDNGYSGPLRILGDHEIALYGALCKPDGIILIAGTGSICYGKNKEGDSHRTGGFGYLIDDEGSGYAIGRDILSAVARAHDGRIGDTILTNMVFEALGLLSIQELLGFIYSKETNKRDIAALSPLLTEACSQNDQAALDILDKSCTELTKLVIPVTQKLNLKQGELALSGSILKNDEMIRNSFKQKIKTALPDVTCVPSKNSAVYGAVLIAANWPPFFK